MTITNSDLNELLDAVRAGGDIDVVRQGVELDAPGPDRRRGHRPDRGRPLRAVEHPDHPAQRHP